MFWLGSALPDLQREAGVRIGTASSWAEPVRDGIACHHAVDAVFHDLAVFRAQSSGLTADLLASGVPRGAARAVGHAGWELLFDGALLDDVALTDSYRQAMSVDLTGQDAGWRRALARRSALGVPSLYADPPRVAELLQRVLGGRRLLAFDRSDIPVVARCLARRAARDRAQPPTKCSRP